LSSIRKSLNRKKVKGAFFVTGRFLEDPKSVELLRMLIKEGHYVGPHSDQHLLYAPWDNRDSLLLSKEDFSSDLMDNTSKIQALGMKETPFFIPPYEWYNSKIVQWSNEFGFEVYNFTPGIRTAADYTYPEMGKRYISSQALMDQLMTYEAKNKLNGSIVLIHIGTDSRRKDKLYQKLELIIDELHRKNYKFVPLDKI
jgi:peptidoglycan/xylan/chitin deacetylase (PgdA/CDA1 family)